MAMGHKSDVEYPVAIQEASRLSGLSEHTLRYYEKIGLLHPISRDASSGHRLYGADDVTTLQSLSYLSACGFSISEMRRYLQYIRSVDNYAAEALKMFVEHEKAFAQKLKALKLQHEYIQTKVLYWQARVENDETKLDEAITKNRKAAEQLLNNNLYRRQK